jgi:hypothetical protein
MRFGKYLPFKTILLFFSIFLVGFVGLYGFASNGVPKRSLVAANKFNDAQIEVALHTKPECETMVGFKPDFCRLYGNTKNITVAVFGDSVANAVAPGIGAVMGNDKEGVINLGMSSCAPFRGLHEQLYDPKDPEKCPNLRSRIYDYILANPNIKTVVLAGLFEDFKSLDIPGSKPDSNPHDIFPNFAPLIEKDISDLQKAGKKIVISYDMRKFPIQAIDCFNRPYMPPRPADFCIFNQENLDKQTRGVAIMDEYFSKRNDVCVINHRDILLKDGNYRFFDDEGKLLIMDDHHLSPYGAEKLAFLIKHSTCYQPANQ